MIKNCVFAIGVLSLALATGCAKGGNGMGSGITVTVEGFQQAGVGLSVTYTASVKPDSANQAVTWSLSGSGCTGTPNPCGSFTSSVTANTVTYQAPATPPSSEVTITATSQADSTAKGSENVTVVQITTTVSPAPVNVGHSLIQQFTARAVPDNAPQTFAWTCTVSGVACANFVSNSSDVAVYTAAESPCGNSCLNVSAVSSADPTGCSAAKACSAATGSIVTSRLSGIYAFRFSGHDNSNVPVAVAGTITANNGTITGGFEDVLTAGAATQHTITSGSYVPSSANDNSTNNAGVLTITSGAFPNKYQVVIDAAGDIRMIESDGHGTGSGVMQKSATAQFNTAAQTFVFGFIGVDAGGHRAGYVGLLPLDGTTNIKTGGLLDANDNGTTTNPCGTPPCAVGGSYQADGSVAGLWHMTLTTGTTQHFDFFVAGGQTKNVPNPLTLYAISTDSVDTDHPALSGSLVFQNPAITYDKTALNAAAVAHLTGVDNTGSNSLVSLLLVDGDGNGNISARFDANNAGTIIASQDFNCTYTSGTSGRYVVTLLGKSSTCTSPALPFVFYASGANRGFLLDQSSSAVLTGGMDPQDTSVGGPQQLLGTFAAASISNATSNVSPLAANLLLTSVNSTTHSVAGTQYPGAQTVAGNFTLTFDSMGFVTGTATLTAPAAASYVIYAVDATDLEMIDVDAAVTNPSIIFAQQ
jgi:hypothetical protein